MKKIECIIRPGKLEDVKSALSKEGILGMTISEVFGAGRQKGFTEKYRGSEVTINLLPKTKIEIFAKDEDVKKIMGIILESARTEEIGDGKIFVMNAVEQVVRIRTGDSGEKAL
jgi:nitrogen regulatory protein PII